MSKETAGNTTCLILQLPDGAIWVATCEDKLDPTVTANWTWTQLPPIPAT